MAKLTITTDDGIVIDTWKDSRDEIGNVDRAANRAAIADDVANAIRRARLLDNRQGSSGEPQRDSSCGH